MNQDDFKKILDEALESINKRFDRVEGQLNDLDTGLPALNRRMDANTASVVELESTIKGYADMYKVNNSNSNKLEKRIEILEDKSGITPPPELTLTDVA